MHTPPDTPATSEERATVTGHVVDVHGTPVAGASVAIRATGEQATAGSDGAFALDVPANTTLTLAASAPTMATTLLQQFMLSPGARTAFDIPLLASDHLNGLVAMGPNPSGGAVAVVLKSLSTTPINVATPPVIVELTPANFGKVLYAPAQPGMPDPDPSLPAITVGTAPMAWALGVLPHVSIMKLALHGAQQLEPPYAIDDVTWPGTFTVDAGALTLVTLYTP